MRTNLASFFLLSSLLLAKNALAQTTEEFDKGGEGAADKKHLEQEASKKMPGEKDKPPPVDPHPDKYDPKEDPTKAYRFIGLRFRDFIVPSFMIQLFADGGPGAVNVASFGPELSIRKDHTEYDFSLNYADYSMNPFLFKGKKDGDEAYELTSSSMKFIYLELDLLYDIPIDDKGRFDFLIGGGVGVGGIAGDLYRSQAYPANGGDPKNPDPRTPGQWSACSGPVASPTTKTGAPYCDGSNAHFTKGTFPKDSYSEPSWANGGSKPFIFPYISIPQISLRIKPIKQIQTRVDAGFSLTGFYFGFMAGYGL